MGRIINFSEDKIEPYSDDYYKRILQKISYKFSPCASCGHPKINGYLCSNCDFDNPHYPITNPKFTIEIDEVYYD